MTSSQQQPPAGSGLVLPHAASSIDGVSAEILSPASALAWLADQGAEAAEWCTSSAWAQAALSTLGSETLRFVGFRIGTTPQTSNLDAVCTLAHHRADWRSGSPGRDEIRWPVDTLGYQYAPVARQSLDHGRLSALQSAWFPAVQQLFPNHRFHLRRCAPAWVDRQASSLGSAKAWIQARPDAPSWRGQKSQDLQALRTSLHRKHRKDLDYYYRRIEREGCRWRDYEATDEHTLQAALSALTELHRSRLAAKGLSPRQLRQSACLDATHRGFLSELAVHNRPNLRLSLLWQGPHPVGGCLGFAFGSDYVAMMSGQDTLAAHGLDLGRQVLWHQIQAQAARQPTRIDLLGGDLDYKREFGLVADPTVEFEFEPSRAAAWRRRAAVRLINTLRGMRPSVRRPAKANARLEPTQADLSGSKVK